jgi:NitT/TauT family transport system substrate-binding protein
MEVNQLPDALLQGKIDAFAAWEPTPSALLAAHPGRFTQIYRQTSYSYFVLSRSLLEQHPATARELSAAILRAVRWLKKDAANLVLASRWTADGMAVFTGKPSRFSAADVARVTAQDLLDVPGAPLLNDSGDSGSHLRRLFTFMKQQNQLPPHATWENVQNSLKPELLRDIAAQPARYRLNSFHYADGILQTP